MTRPVGRPPKPPGEGATERVELLLTPAELADLDRKRGTASRARYVCSVADLGNRGAR